MFRLLVLIFYTLLAVIVTFPLILNLDRFVFDRFDWVLINWIINWGIHSLSTIGNIFDANIFFPFQNTFAYSDFHIASVLTSLPFVLLFKEPLIASNINFLLGFIITAFSIFLLVELLTKDKKMALLAGALFSFGTIHLNYSHHLQLFGFWPFIFTIYFYFKEKWIPFIFLFVLSVATMPLFFFFFLAFFLFVPKKNVKVLITVFLTSTLVFIPYFLVSKEFNYVRPITDAINFSLKIHDFFKPNENSRLSLYTGIATIILLVLLVLKKVKINRYLVLALVCLVLAFGPAFHIFEDTVHVGPLPGIPMPYTIFYYLLPGFSGFRTPSRWILLAFFAFTIGLSIALKNKLSKNIVALLVVLIVLEIPFPLSFATYPKLNDFPPEQIWLKENYVNEPIIQFPIYGWFDGDKVALETLRMHYSLVHLHPMYNGYSGFSPKSWESDVKWLQKEFPSEKSLLYLENKGIKLVLVPRSWAGKMLKFKQIKLVKEFKDTQIYAF